jgi:hypothetical protein
VRQFAPDSPEEIGEVQTALRAMQIHLRLPLDNRLTAALARRAADAVRILQTPVPIHPLIKATERRARIIFGEGARRVSSSTFTEQHLGVGDCYPVVCPRCGGTTRRVHRKPIDRILSVVVKVWRFRCIDKACGWEDPVRMKPHHFYRVH